MALPDDGKFMFHAHQSEFTELGWQGFFEVVGLEASRRAQPERS